MKWHFCSSDHNSHPETSERARQDNISNSQSSLIGNSTCHSTEPVVSWHLRVCHNCQYTRRFCSIFIDKHLQSIKQENITSKMEWTYLTFYWYLSSTSISYAHQQFFLNHIQVLSSPLPLLLFFSSANRLQTILLKIEKYSNIDLYVA